MIPEELEYIIQKSSAALKSKINSDGSLELPVPDLAAYFKFPLFLIKIGQIDLAKLVLTYIKNNFLEKNGDFLSKEKMKSCKPEYIEFYAYMNGWIIRAAQILRINDISRDCLHSDLIY